MAAAACITEVASANAMPAETGSMNIQYNCTLCGIIIPVTGIRMILYRCVS